MCVCVFFLNCLYAECKRHRVLLLLFILHAAQYANVCLLAGHARTHGRGMKRVYEKVPGAHGALIPGKFATRVMYVHYTHTIIVYDLSSPTLYYRHVRTRALFVCLRLSVAYALNIALARATTKPIVVRFPIVPVLFPRYVTLVRVRDDGYG